MSTKTGDYVAQSALAIAKSGLYVYWYGAKNQKCTADLLFKLAAAYPSVYTTSYVNSCLQDIKAGKVATDCSGLVSKVYGWGGLGTYTIKARSDVHEWKKTPRNGMMVWKPTHIGIYYNGKVIEARGHWYGLTYNREYKASDWSAVLYVDGYTYSNPDAKKRITDTVVNAVIAGKYGNGNARKTALIAAGYTAEQVEQIQQKVNEKLKGV